MGQIISPIDFQRTVERLKECGFNPLPESLHISIHDAKRTLYSGLRYFTGESAVWLPEYEEVAEWLNNNKGRGLLCYGNCGRGKTLICLKILPLLLNHYCGRIAKCYSAISLADGIDEAMRNKIVIIDDVGTENISVKFGERRIPFAEIVDEAEKKGILLVVTTNLTRDQISQKYGERTMDRLTSITKCIKFKGGSLRR